MHGEAEFVEYVRADGSRLLRIAYLMVGNRTDAEDMVQIALLRVMRAWSRAQDDPRAYARRVLTNLATDRWRWLRARPHQVALDESFDVPSTADDAAEWGVDTRRDLLDALRRLPARQRAVLVLRYFEQMSEAETAAVLGLAPGTVKTHTARGLASLRERLPHASEGNLR